MTTSHKLASPCRSVLYAPASNEKAIQKALTLACDAVIFDLEDAVAPGQKGLSRQRLAELFAGGLPGRPSALVRVNALSSPWGRDDLAEVAGWGVHAVVLPKVDGPQDIVEAAGILTKAGAGEDVKLWAMIETPKALLNLPAIAALGDDTNARLTCLVAGTNDLVKEMRIRDTDDGAYLLPWLMQIIAAARAGGLDVLDGVTNDFRNLDRFSQICERSAAMGFDGKTLIHPSQIDLANQAFSPSPQALLEAAEVVKAFALPENADQGVIALHGQMVERLHLEQARRLLAQAEAMG